MSRKSKNDHDENKIGFLTFVEKTFPGSNPKPNFKGSIPTGCCNLDLILPSNGIPSRGITEVYGPECSGKSTLALYLMLNASKIIGKKCLYLDFEHKMQPDYARKLGIDFFDPSMSNGDPSFYLLQPQSIEEAYQYIDKYGQDFSLIVIDSVTAMRPREKKKSSNDEDTYFENPSLVTKVYSAFFSYASHKVYEHDLALLCLSQTRMSGDTHFRMTEKPSGGRAQRHFISLSIALSPSALTGSKSVRGTKLCPVTDKTLPNQPLLTHVTATIVKDCVGGSRGLQTEFYLFNDGGVCNAYPLLEQAKKVDIYKVGVTGYHQLFTSNESKERKAIVKDSTLLPFLRKIELDRDAMIALIVHQYDFDRLLNIYRRSAAPKPIIRDESEYLYGDHKEESPKKSPSNDDDSCDTFQSLLDAS